MHKDKGEKKEEYGKQKEDVITPKQTYALLWKKNLCFNKAPIYVSVFNNNGRYSCFKCENYDEPTRILLH